MLGAPHAHVWRTTIHAGHIDIFHSSMDSLYIYLGKKIVRAMYDYQSDGGGADDLNFQKGDIMEITSE